MFTSINYVWIGLHPDFQSPASEEKEHQAESGTAVSIDDAWVRAFEHFQILGGGQFTVCESQMYEVLMPRKMC